MGPVRLCTLAGRVTHRRYRAKPVLKFRAFIVNEKIWLNVLWYAPVLVLTYKNTQNRYESLVSIQDSFSHFGDEVWCVCGSAYLSKVNEATVSHVRGHHNWL